MTDTDPAWKPDPHGRHQYRWFDGNAWTDQVSDDGTVSTDPPEPTPPADAAPPPAPAPAEPTVSMPAAGGPPPPSSPAPPAASGGGGGGNKVPLIIGGVAILALIGAGLFFFLGGDDDGLSGNERAELIALLREDGLNERDAGCILDSLVSDLGADEVRRLARDPDAEPTAAQFTAILAASERCGVDMFGMSDDDPFDDTTDTTADDTTDTTADDASGGSPSSIPSGILDLFVEGMMQDGQLTEAQARCFAEEFLALDGVDLGGLMANPDGFEEEMFSDPTMLFAMFAIFETCGIDMVDLMGGGFDDFGSSGSNYGDDARLDALWDACAAGDGQACDDLYWDTPIGSEYEEFGATCGGRFGFREVRCADEL